MYTFKTELKTDQLQNLIEGTLVFRVFITLIQTLRQFMNLCNDSVFVFLCEVKSVDTWI